MMDLLEKVIALFLEDPPWWLWALVVIVPACVLLTVREFFCWFCKINKVVGRLEKIERRIHALQLASRPKPAETNTDKEG